MAARLSAHAADCHIGRGVHFLSDTLCFFKLSGDSYKILVQGLHGSPKEIILMHMLYSI